MNRFPKLQNKLLICVLINLFASSCNTSGPSWPFGRKSPHEHYSDKIKNAGLDKTALGKQWLSAAEKSLTSPLTVNLPYSETGYFPANEAGSVGITFKGRRGEKLSIKLSTKPTKGFAVFLDLWRPSSAQDKKAKFLLSADTTLAAVKYDVEEDGDFILRIQPELLKGGEYTLIISTGPTLAFPVTPKVKSNIGSFWGVARDAGARRHEGIDIFAPRGTALVAAADGVVTRVNENVLGGKVVFLSPHSKNYTLYYAHLDKQLVEAGQKVKTGDTIGLMGNTGNARTTSPHLHFGIYTSSGAVDPLPFVNRVIRSPGEITAPLNNIDNWVRNNNTVKLLSEPSGGANQATMIEPNTLIKVEAATASWYKVMLPGGERGFVSSSIVVPLTTPVRKSRLKTAQAVFDEPNDLAARKTILAAGEPINIVAGYKDYYYVSNKNIEGWIQKGALTTVRPPG
jgi:murein DD-endopeptidase MepM/ murein hydrolase activator NlpD/SH3-like domain-containing protein